MESYPLNTPADADAQGSTGGPSGSTWAGTREPGQTGRDSQTGKDDASIRSAREDADSFGRKAADATQGYLQDAKAKASATVQAGKEYAQDAISATGQKIDRVKSQATDLKQRGMQFAADEPMKAVAYAAAGGAALTAVLMTLIRGRR